MKIKVKAFATAFALWWGFGLFFLKEYEEYDIQDSIWIWNSHYDFSCMFSYKSPYVLYK